MLLTAIARSVFQFVFIIKKRVKLKRLEGVAENYTNFARLKIYTILEEVWMLLVYFTGLLTKSLKNQKVELIVPCTNLIKSNFLHKLVSEEIF